MNEFNNRNSDSPCKKDCPDRDPWCHSECKKYAKWRAKKDKERDERLKQKRDSEYTIDLVMDKKNRDAMRRKSQPGRKIYGR